MIRTRFLFIFLCFRNVCNHVLSGCLTRIYGLGFNLAILMVLQILVGVCLACIFFNCYLSLNWFFVLFIWDFDLGFILRSLHISFTSLIYLLLYIHILKVIFILILFDTHLLVWFIGFLIYIFVVIIAFIGYVLPCTMMSYWGLTVFSNILATVPILGLWLCYWIWGCEFINDFTLLKLHSLHIVFPILLLFLIVLHFFCLHYFLSSDGFYDRFTFYTERLLFCFWYYLRDCFIFLLIITIYSYFIIINWYFVFHEESWVIVNVLKTSDKILPEWFFLFLFGFLKSVPDKFLGLFILVLLLFSLFLFILNSILWFTYCRSSFVWFSFSISLFYGIWMSGFLSLYVILCFPIWLEIQFWVILIFLWIVIRLD